ncbi:MAG: copper-translocating P-type ATPase [Phycisphaerae bacterium]|nr:copper-translocating P-type ATPase [Phycisphaerae bacterium]
MHQHADACENSTCGGGHHGGLLGPYHDLILPGLAGVTLLAAWITQTFTASSDWVHFALYALCYLLGGGVLFLDTLRGLARGRFDIHFLMLVAGIGAAILGRFFEGGLLFFLFSLGHALEHYAMGRARNAIRALGSLTPKTALRIDQNAEHLVPVESLEIGDRIRIRSNARISADGTIVEGSSTIDQSSVTGESIPVERGAGDKVFAGSLNGDQVLVVRVDKLAGDTTMARMITLVEEARANKGTSQRFTERFTRIYVPIILVGTILLILLPPLLDALTWSESFIRAMTVLVGASPCALAISTPSAVLSGIAQAARNGVLIKGGRQLEALGRVQAIGMDKTGTLTLGRPELEEMALVSASSEEEALKLAGALEFQSTHPLAKAITRTLQARNITAPAAEEVTSEAGIGVVGMIDGRQYRIGSEKILAEAGLPEGETTRRIVERFQSEGRTTMILASDDSVLAVFGLADQPRTNAAETIGRLKRIGLRKIVMLTGDNRRVGEIVGTRLGVDAIHAELMPEEKIEVIKGLARGNKSVAMIGDGVNDAPALAAASVSIAMGAGGTDVALETADIALMADDLSKIPFTIGLSRKVKSIIEQNFLISMGVIAALVPFAALGVTPMWVAVIFHEGSTLVVVCNALRLLAYKGHGE